MGNAATGTEHFLKSLAGSQTESKPFRHWLLSDICTSDVVEKLIGLPFEFPAIDRFVGTRESHNRTRVFFNPEKCSLHDVCRNVVATFMDKKTIEGVENTCEISLKNSFLRIEYCEDTNGFWLEPHLDINAKLFTLLVYLSSGPGHEALGTDIFDEDKNHVRTVPFQTNHGLIFIPGNNTWHGFNKRPIMGVRKLLIVNYVIDAWRDTDQLSFPRD